MMKARRGRGADQLGDGGHKGVQIGGGNAVDLLHKLQCVEAVAVGGRAMVPARDEHATLLRQVATLPHCPVWRLHSTPQPILISREIT